VPTTSLVALGADLLAHFDLQERLAFRGCTMREKVEDELPF
jgi:hypothetical protein